MKNDDELDKFKKEIDLVKYAAGCGYQISKKEQYRNHTIMRSDTNKITISIKDGHYVWNDFSRGIGGSIIDFVKVEKGINNLGHIRKELRSFLGSGYKGEIPGINYKKDDDKPAKENFQKYLKTITASNIHPEYLHNRHIAPSTTQSYRFKGSIFKDQRNNVVFLHKDLNGICGAEKRNYNFKGIEKGSQKGLWVSRCFKNDDTIVISESAIDALSYAQLKGKNNYRYIAFSGGMRPEQLELVELAIKKVDTVIIAIDNDSFGKKLSKDLAEIAERNGKKYKIDFPETKDWNLDLELYVKNELTTEYLKLSEELKRNPGHAKEINERLDKVELEISKINEGQEKRAFANQYKNENRKWLDFISSDSNKNIIGKYADSPEIYGVQYHLIEKSDGKFINGFMIPQKDTDPSFKKGDTVIFNGNKLEYLKNSKNYLPNSLFIDSTVINEIIKRYKNKTGNQLNFFPTGKVFGKFGGSASINGNEYNLIENEKFGFIVPRQNKDDILNKGANVIYDGNKTSINREKGNTIKRTKEFGIGR